ncbi:MAG: hypothetical protein KC620_13610 [Myxococcales bacterium]|nr:hypothetical protein [Myxococcales bacterium]
MMRVVGFRRGAKGVEVELEVGPGVVVARPLAAALADGARSVALSGLEDIQTEWRRSAHGWIQDLGRLAVKWEGVRRFAEFVGNAVHKREAEEAKRRIRTVQDKIYFVIDNYLGGLKALDRDAAVDERKRALGALPLVPVVALIAGAAAAITYFITSMETRAEEVRTEQLREARRMTESSDPAVRAAGVKAAGDLTKVWQTAAEADADRAAKDKTWAQIAKWALGALVVGGAGYLAWKNWPRIEGALRKREALS